MQSLVDLMRVIGIESYSHEMPLAGLMADALAYPLMSGGNIGLRIRSNWRAPMWRGAGRRPSATAPAATVSCSSASLPSASPHNAFCTFAHLAPSRVPHRPVHARYCNGSARTPRPRSPTPTGHLPHEPIERVQQTGARLVTFEIADASSRAFSSLNGTGSTTTTFCAPARAATTVPGLMSRRSGPRAGRGRFRSGRSVIPTVVRWPSRPTRCSRRNSSGTRARGGGSTTRNRGGRVTGTTTVASTASSA